MLCMKKKSWIIIGIVIILILSFMTFGFLKLKQNIKQDKEITKQNIEKVTKYYNEFNDLAVSFNEKSMSLTDKISNTFFTNLKEEQENFQNILEELNDIQNNMELISKELETLCKATYIDATINRNCSSYQVSLNSANLVYDETVENYNHFITQYNAWTQENEGYEEIPLYQKNETR